MTDVTRSFTKSTLNEISKNLFAYKPIVLNHSDLDIRSKVAVFVLKVCGYDNATDSEKASFWMEWRDEVYKIMKQTKNSVSYSIKERMLRKLILLLCGVY